MSTPLLLTRSNVPIHSTSERGTPSLLHLGPFGPCQRPSKNALAKSPLLKSRRRATHIPPIVSHNPAVTTGQHFPPPIGYKFSYPVATTTPSKDDSLFGCPSPPSPVDYSGSGPPLSAREVSFSRVEASSLKERPSAVHTRPSRVTCLIGSEGFSPTSESITSVGALRQYTPTSPTFPTTVRVNDAYSDSVKSKFMPCSPTHSFTSRTTLQKSQSTLIMPSLFTFFRPDAISPPGTGKQSRRDRLPRDISSRSLSTTSRSPSPLIRKCHTVTSLSSQGNQPPYTSTSANSVTPVQKKQKKLAFFRRISPSKSAVFSSQTRSQPSAPSSIRKSSSTAFALGLQRHRKASVISMVPHGELGNGMWPHKEHPEEEENSSPEGVLSEGRKDASDATSIAAGGCSRCASVGSIASRRLSTVTNGGGPDGIFCRLCLTDVSVRELYQLQLCQCRFCTYCMCMYATLKIREGEPVIECPDSNCDCRGELTLEELESLVGKELVALHLKFRRDREVDLDPLKTWCPRPGCETVVQLSAPKMGGRPHCSCCPTCNTVFCAACSSSWHSGKPCLKNSGLYEVPLNDCIKRCPRCKVPIERDAGCAQMQCKKCKHVFCWYCLASLEDDFLLRHYDKGPCKNKLGHSRASVLLHRAQVVVIFAGFGLLLIIASPLLLFVGPCLLCKSCRSCSRPEMDEDVSNV